MTAYGTHRPNRLIDETSPYLTQHAYNPVEWHAWGDEALYKAKEEDKPILLSIGYSSCHWCHVMEHESFENERIAALMNEGFINIKVDREERPDVDSIYMSFVQMTTGSGGWPLTVFLTPDLVPFYGGTYFPPEDRYGRPGFARILQGVRDAFVERRQEIEAGRSKTLQRLEEAFSWGLAPGDLEERILDQAHDRCYQQFDHRLGGFGQAPKFPSSMVLGFLVRYCRRTERTSARRMVEVTLDEMARGGIYDQLGGGFHRYSVDDRWLVPHFEKMLYDNALLARAYLEAWQLTGNRFYRQIVHETLGYVQREMRDPEEGGFYSAEDADSEGHEGKFYVWSLEEVESALDSETARIFCDYYDVTAHGNFEGSNILHPRLEREPYAKSLGMTPEDLDRLLAGAKRRLFEIRRKRIRPGLDDKVLASWNGMMLTAFAEAAFAFDSSEYLETSLRNGEFLYSEMWTGDRLHRNWTKGRARLNGYLDDYAQVVEGWLALYQATGDPVWVDRAAEVTDVKLKLFWDSEQGDFHFTSTNHERLVIRHKEFMDNATPSGNAVSCLNLLRLHKLLGRSDYLEKAENMLRRVSLALQRHPLAFGYWLQALDHYLGPVHEIAVVGTEAQRTPLVQVVRDQYLPNKILAVASGEDDGLGYRIPLLAGKTSIDGGAAAYVCRNYVCRRPVHTPEELEQAIKSAS